MTPKENITKMLSNKGEAQQLHVCFYVHSALTFLVHVALGRATLLALLTRTHTATTGTGLAIVAESTAFFPTTGSVGLSLPAALSSSVFHHF